MSTVECLSETSAERALPTSVRRVPFYLESQGQPLFAWLHHRQPAACFSHGVLFCPPQGYEQVHAHRSWRVLADALAAAGFPVLRFDYHGTGDSAGSDEDADRLAAWLASIHDAKAWLREKLGCTQISMIGLRLGATLAMQAAAAEEVDSLLLWAPVVSGRHYVREMKALCLTATIKPPPSPEAPGEIEAAGFVLSKQTAEEIGKLDLLKVAPRCRRALILTRDDLPQDCKLLEHLRALDIHAEQAVQPGYAEMMAEPHFTKVPHQAIAFAVDWLRAGIDPDGALDCDIEKVPRADAWLPQQPIRECVLSIGHEPELVGVLSEPPNKTDLPLILLLNAGSAYRIGPNRLHVLLARRLAAQGFRCLRIDLGGLGDSVAPGRDGANDSYAASAFIDIETTLEHLQANLHAKRVVLIGLCSGAYFAFQSAVQMASPQLVESVLINPLTFFWQDGMTLESSPTKQHQEFEYYWQAALKPSNWLKFLSGRTKTGLRGALKTLVERWRLRHRPAEIATTNAGDSSAAHPLRDDLTADLDRLAKTGRLLTCCFSKADPGLSIMNFNAKRKVNELLQAGKMRVAFFDDADHTFSFRVPRQALVQAIADHLCRRYIQGKC